MKLAIIFPAIGLTMIALAGCTDPGDGQAPPPAGGITQPSTQ